MDQYSICLCGSGKKIKFCKCAPHLQEMLKIVRMIEGEQLVAALDRVTQLLKAQPNEAWLLATRCRILLQLNELEGLEEASARFIRLQPDNSLAKIFRSIVASTRGSLEESCSMLLQSISQDSEVVDALYIQAHAHLIRVLFFSGYYLSAISHAKLLDELAGEQFEEARQTLEMLSNNNSCPAMFREDLPSKPDEAEEAWSERFEEARALLDRMRVNQAKAKLEGILREFGPKPAVLNMLISCKVLLADSSGAAQHAVRLSQDTSLSEEQRIFFLALAMRLDLAASRAGLTVNLVELELPDEEKIVESLLSHELFRSIPASDEMKKELALVTKQEVLPKFVFYFFREAILPDESKAKYSVSWLALFGKQTDRPATLFFFEFQHLPTQNAMRQLLQGMGLNVEGAKRSPVAKVLLGEKVFADSSFIDSNNQIRNLISAPIELRRAMVAYLIDVPIDCLNGLTIKEAVSDPRHHLAIKAIFLNMLDSDVSWLDFSLIRDVHQQLGLAYPKVNGDEDVLDKVGVAAHFWLDLEAISERSFLVYMQSVMSLKLYSMYGEFARACEQRTWSPENCDRIAILKSILLCQLSKDSEELIARVEEVYNLGNKLNMNVGQFGIQLFQLLIMTKQVVRATEMLQRLIVDYPQDPHVVNFLSEFVTRQREATRAQQAVGSLDDELVHHIQARRSSSSSLWTPDGPSNDPVAAPSSESSGSKLWVPGMD